MRKKPTVQEIMEAAPVSAIDALRRNLLFSMLNSISEADMGEVVKAQLDKAREGDTKAAKLLMGMVAEAGQQTSIRNSVVFAEGNLADWKIETRKVITCLIAFQGPQTTEQVAERLFLNGAAAIEVLQCDWFVRENGKWCLTNEARRKVLERNAQARLEV